MTEARQVQETPGAPRKPQRSKGAGVKNALIKYFKKKKVARYGGVCL